MSAMNSFISRDGLTGYLLTDTACTLLPGDVGANGFPGKVVSLPHMRTAFATCGYAHLGSPFQMLASQFSSFDDLAKEFRPRWQHATSNLSAVAESSGLPKINCAVLCMGWSDTESRVKAFIAQTTKQWEPQFFDLILTPDADIETVQHHDFAGPVLFATPARDLLRIMQVQRANAMRAEDDGHRGLIGGAVVLTELTRDSVTQRIVHNWRQDEIVMRLNKAAGKAA